MIKNSRSILFSLLIIALGCGVLYHIATQPMTYQLLNVSEPMTDNKFNFTVANKKVKKHYQFEMPNNIYIAPDQQVTLTFLFEHTHNALWGLNIGEKDVITEIKVNGEKVWASSNLDKPIHVTEKKS